MTNDEARDATDAASSVSNESPPRSGFVNPNGAFSRRRRRSARRRVSSSARSSPRRGPLPRSSSPRSCALHRLERLRRRRGLEAAGGDEPQRASDELLAEVTKSATPGVRVRQPSACGYAVDAPTQGVTDLLARAVRRRFEASGPGVRGRRFRFFTRACRARAVTPASLSVTATESARRHARSLGASDADDPFKGCWSLRTRQTSRLGAH